MIYRYRIFQEYEMDIGNRQNSSTGGYRVYPSLEEVEPEAELERLRLADAKLQELQTVLRRMKVLAEQAAGVPSGDRPELDGEFQQLKGSLGELSREAEQADNPYYRQSGGVISHVSLRASEDSGKDFDGASLELEILPGSIPGFFARVILRDSGELAAMGRLVVGTPMAVVFRLTGARIDLELGGLPYGGEGELLS